MFYVCMFYVCMCLCMYVSMYIGMFLSGWPGWANFRILGDCFLWPNIKSSPKFWATFFHGKSSTLVLTKNGLGHILGDFLTNSSGHSGFYVCMFLVQWYNVARLNVAFFGPFSMSCDRMSPVPMSTTVECRLWRNVDYGGMLFITVVPTALC
jgi:hypothetical protein